MSSNEPSLPLRLFSFALLLGSCLIADAQDKPASSSVVCPASIAVAESVAPISGWTVTPTKAQHSFERISVYNGTPGNQEFDLAPDDQKEKGNKVIQTWNLKAYRTMNIFVRCRYHGTSVVLLQDLPNNLTACTLRFSLNPKGKIVGDSSMECR